MLLNKNTDSKNHESDDNHNDTGYESDETVCCEYKDLFYEHQRRECIVKDNEQIEDIDKETREEIEERNDIVVEGQSNDTNEDQVEAKVGGGVEVGAEIEFPNLNLVFWRLLFSVSAKYILEQSMHPKMNASFHFTCSDE